MKRPLARLATAILVAFALLSLWKWRSGETRPPDGAQPQQPRKPHIQSFWSLYHQATAARLQRDWTSAVAGFQQALALDPRHEDSYYYLGTTLMELGDYGRAAEVFSELTRLNPQSSRAFMQLGIALSTRAPGAQTDSAAAARAFARCAEINREETGPFLRLGLLHLNQNHPEEALRLFLLASRMGSPEGFFLAGYTRFLQGQYREAAPLFQSVLEINAREKRISGRGVLSEGDLKPSAERKELSPLEHAGLKALLFLYWAAVRSRAYAPSVPAEFRLPPRPGASSAGITSELRGPRGAPGRGLWMDFDGDRRPDLLLVGPGQEIRLYRNHNGRLVEATAAAGLAAWKDFSDATSFDYDGDGRADLYLVRAGWMGIGQNVLLRNTGGRFTESTAAAGLSGQRATTRALPLDFDGDNRLDLLEVGNAGPEFPAVRLFHNQAGRFVERSRELGLVYEGNVVDAAVADYDGDSRPDIFLLGWRREVKLFRNVQGRFFRDVTAEAGLQGVVGNGFSALFFDYDRDGQSDLLVTAHASWERSLQGLLTPTRKAGRETPRLFRNQGNGRFREVTAEVGLDQAYGVMQAIAADLDGDGWPDLVLALGGLEREGAEPSVVLRNLEGKRFSHWLYLPDFDTPGNATGVAAADLDQDGRPELYLSGVGLLRWRRFSEQARAPGAERRQ